ncbi:MAG: PKD domain-containing protein [Pseudomonadota bacterium]
MLDLAFNCIDAGSGPPPFVTDYTLSLTVSLDAPVVPGINAAPAATWFRVANINGSSVPGPTDVYDPEFHDLFYFWRFGDPVSGTPFIDLNIPNRWKNLNSGFGPRPVHIYNSPGTYNVECYVFDPVARIYGVATQQVTIGDPLTVFAGAQTLVYDPAGVGGAPADAQIFTDWAAMLGAWGSQGGNTRVLLASGVIREFESNDRISTGAVPVNNLRLEAMNPTAEGHVRPILRTLDETRIIDDRGPQNGSVELIGIDMQGSWDAATETGKLSRGTNSQKNTSTLADFLWLAHRCSFSGFETIRPLQDMNALGGRAYCSISECRITNWQNYGTYIGPDDKTNIVCSITGSSISQNADGLSGGPKNGFYNNHGCIRETGSRYVYIDACDMMSRNGWSLGTSLTKDGFGGTSDQPCWRINSVGDRDRSAHVTRLVAEGGIGMNASTGATELEGNYKVSGVIIVATSMAYANQLIEYRLGGLTMENALLIRPDVEDYGVNSRFVRWIGQSNNLGDAQSAAAGLRFHNIETVDLRTTATAEGQGNPPLVEQTNTPADPFVVTEDNNLQHAPNLSGATQVGSETLNLTDLLDGAVFRHRGPKFGFGVFKSTVGAIAGGDWANGASHEIPYSQLLDGIAVRSGGVFGDQTGSATDQAYWQANEQTDTKHMIKIGAGNLQAGMIFAQDGAFSVTFTATGAQITNTTGSTWSSGSNVQVKLDRSSRLPTFRSQFDNTAQSVGSVIATDPDTLTAPSGRSAYNDIRGAERPATGGIRGAVG